MELLQGQEGNRLSLFILLSTDVFNVWSCATVNFNFSALLGARYSVENKRRWILTRAGIAYYMQYHVMRIVCCIGQATDAVCWSGWTKSRADDSASLLLLLLIFQALVLIVVHWSL